MANYKVDEQIIKRLSDEDREGMLSIYQHRCLDERLLYQYFYSKADIKQAYTNTHIKDLISYRLLEELDYGQSFPALFLTTKGVETVKFLYGDGLKRLYKYGDESISLPMASDLKMNRKNVNHQMHLNHFVLEFESYAKGKTFFRYYDEKFMPPASDFMMPDGMLELSGCFLFLEMDMGTESSGRLAQKWNSYRSFLNSPGFFYQEKPIVMLFILDGVSNPDVRKKNVAASLFGYIADRVNGQFEVYIDAPAALHEIIQTHLIALEPESSCSETEVYKDIRQTQGFLLSKPAFLTQVDAPFEFYIRKLNDQKKILTINGRPQEFLLDIWLDGRLSVLRNLVFFNRLSRQIVSMTKRPLSYLVVVPSEKWALTVLRIINSPQPQGVYFTTPTRLSACNWEGALFYIDQLGNLMHFTDASLKDMVHERRMAKK